MPADFCSLLERLAARGSHAQIMWADRREPALFSRHLRYRRVKVLLPAHIIQDARVFPERGEPPGHSKNCASRLRIIACSDLPDSDTSESPCHSVTENAFDPRRIWAEPVRNLAPAVEGANVLPMFSAKIFHNPSLFKIVPDRYACRLMVSARLHFPGGGLGQNR